MGALGPTEFQWILPNITYGKESNLIGNSKLDQWARNINFLRW